jgi:putative transposase
MIKTFIFKLYQSKKNKVLHDHIDGASSVYNYCISAHRENYKLHGKHLNKYDLQKKLTVLKRSEEHASWNTLGSQVVQDVTDRIDRAYKLSLQNASARKNARTKRIVRPPSYKKAWKYKSITLKQSGYALLEGNRIKIGKEIFKFSKSRPIEGKIKTLTIKRNQLGELFLIFCCEVPDIQATRTMTGKSAGLDFVRHEAALRSCCNKHKQPVVLSTETRGLNKERP